MELASRIVAPQKVHDFFFFTSDDEEMEKKTRFCWYKHSCSLVVVCFFFYSRKRLARESVDCVDLVWLIAWAHALYFI